ncbi:helix-turn-helix transcriptional regulator [Deinococcus sp. QL22]|uniref:helix-turn-helix transcriptional regulator n=1 Tax=Deinococcus sp. QL22 TaxID=2939437 RepID=UPI002017AA20|nr:AAA family ATPase [Deinococcus sp. QL22]UQN08681.1 AAA family ATPase [Deinococcus sp. QL22]
MNPLPASTLVLIGRVPEQAALAHAVRRCREGRGGVLLISGEAGIGKTQLLETVLLAERLPALRGSSRQTRTAAPFSPIAALLRAGMALVPGVLDQLPLREHLALLLPELGATLSGNPPPVSPALASKGAKAQTTPLALQQAVRSALEALMQAGPLALVLEDLQWADHATLQLLPLVAEWLTDSPALLIGTFRTEELPRAHPLRRARLELRRTGRLEELGLEPLGRVETADLASAVLGAPLAPPLAELLYQRTEGVPLFVRELVGALWSGGRLAPDQTGQLGLLAPGTAAGIAAVPQTLVPQTLRDAILLGLDRFPPEARAAAETAAVLGLSFEANVLRDLLADDSTFDTLTERGLLVWEGEQAAFRHALIRDAICAGIPWARRRTLHRQVAAQLEAAGAPPSHTAEHWLAGHEPERARAALVASAQASCRLHAYRDAAEAAGRALELWPAGVEEARRLEVLDQLGHCAQTCGLLPEASRAWREAAGARRDAGDLHGWAESQRHLAGSLELQGLWEQALEARRVAADAFCTGGWLGQAAEERLAVGAALRAGGSCTAALASLARALEEARTANRPDLEARILGQQGNALARTGKIELGLQVTRDALNLALHGGFVHATAEVLHRMADALEHAGDYAAARDTYAEALELCEASGSAAAYACRACVAVPLYQTGAWDRAATECRLVLDSVAAPLGPRAVAGAMLGTVLAHRGQPSRARPLLLEALALGRQTGSSPVQMRALWGLALADEVAGRPMAAAGWARDLLDVWEGIEDHYHILFPMRWASTLFASTGGTDDLRRAADALGRAAHLSGGPTGYSALAHALAEVAWAEGQPDLAANQFGIAAQLLNDARTPFEEASTRLRAGQVLAALGQHGAAVAHVVAAHRTARNLNAVALVGRAAHTLQELGQRPERRGARTPADQLVAGLTQRQLEVLRLVALGRTDKAIAQVLMLSPRTVEMHVGRILASLDSHSRAEAVGKAAEMGLLRRGEQSIRT